MTALSFPYPGLALAGLRGSFKSLCFVVWFVLAVCAGKNALAACPTQPPKLRVTDSAGVLGDKADYIAARLGAYQQASGHQLYLLILPSLDGVSIEECAVNVFKDWKLGRKGIDDGVLLLVAVKEHKIRIEVGYGLEGTLTDAKSSRIIHEVMGPLLARGDYADGVDKGLGAIMEVLGGAAVVVEMPQAPSPQPANPGSGAMPAPIVFVLLVFALLLTEPMGILGLAIFIALVATFAHLADWGAAGYLLAVLVCAAWCVNRWFLICGNVRIYHLKRARNKTHAWIWYFCAFGIAEPVRPQKKESPRTSDSSFGDSDSSFSFSGGDIGGDSGGGDSDSSDGGGSGGGGASGDY